MVGQKTVPMSDYFVQFIVLPILIQIEWVLHHLKDNMAYYQILFSQSNISAQYCAISQLNSIKQGEVVVALGRRRGFKMMVGKWNWLFSLVCGIWTFLIDHITYTSDRFWNTSRYSYIISIQNYIYQKLKNHSNGNPVLKWAYLYILWTKSHDQRINL